MLDWELTCSKLRKYFLWEVLILVIGCNLLRQSSTVRLLSASFQLAEAANLEKMTCAPTHGGPTDPESQSVTPHPTLKRL